MASRNMTALVAVALAAAAALGYWGYNAHQQQEARRTMATSIADVADRLGRALPAEGGKAAGDAQRAKLLEEQAAAAEGALQAVKALGTSGDAALADAADFYLTGARDILSKQAELEGRRLSLAVSLEALREHMRADNHTSAWVRQAVKVREQASKDFRAYRLSADALGRFLETYAAAQARIAAYVAPSTLVADDTVARARQRLLDETALLAATVEKSPDAFR